MRRTHHSSCLRGHTAGRIQQLGKPEVHEFDLSVAVNQDVLRFDVTVNNAAIVGVLQAVADLRRKTKYIRRWQIRIAEQLAQVGAIDIFHHDETPRSGLACIVHIDDVGMVELCQCSRFLLEAFQAAITLGNFLREQLDGNGSVEIRLPRLVDGTHAAVTDQLQQFQLREVRCQFPNFWRDKTRIPRVRCTCGVGYGLSKQTNRAKPPQQLGELIVFAALCTRYSVSHRFFPIDCLHAECLKQFAEFIIHIGVAANRFSYFPMQSRSGLVLGNLVLSLHEADSS